MLKFEKSHRVARKAALGSNERYFNKAGQLNAGSVKEARKIQGALMRDVASGNVQWGDEDELSRKEKLFKGISKEDFANMWNDKDSDSWKDFGSAIALEITEELDREGLMRKCFRQGDINTSEIPRFRVRTKNVVAMVSTALGAVNSQFIRDRYVEPDETFITAKPMVSEKDIAQGAADLVEDVYLRSRQAVVVGEDKLWYTMLQNSVGVANAQASYVGGITPSLLANSLENVRSWNLVPENLVIGSTATSAFLNDSSGFSGVLGVVTQDTLIRTGQLATLWGMNILTDGFRDTNQQVLNPLDVFILSSPDTLGGYTDRYGVVSDPVDGAHEGVPARGFFIRELISCALVNPRGCQFGLVS